MQVEMINDEVMVILQVVLVIFILACLLSLIRYLNILKYEKRLRRYVVDDVKKQKMGLFGVIEYRYKMFEHAVSKMLSKSKLLTKYSRRYLVYINRNNRNQVTPMDFVTRKILISIGFVLTIIISNILRGVMFSLLQILCGLIIGFYLLDIFHLLVRKKDIKVVEDDLYKAISIMSNSFRAGKSIMQAIAIVASETDGPLREEFSYMLTDLNYGLDDEQVLERFSERVKIPEVKYMTTSLIVLNKTGGDIVEIFKTVEDSILSRRKLNHELKMLTASSNLIFKILVSMPVFTSLFIYTLNPSYFSVLITTSIGNIILAIIVLLYIIYIFIIKRIMKVEGI